MSTKDCGNHGSHHRHKVYRRLFACFLALVIVVLFVILVIWLVLRPTKPRFTLQNISVYQFNLSTNPQYLLSSTLQVTVTTRNPNDNIGIYYDKLDIYASYKNQQITIPTTILPIYQGHNDVNVWSPYLYTAAAPIAPYLAVSLSQDENAGYLLLYIKIDGRLRWKVGSWISGTYLINVNCPAFLSIDNGKGSGIAPSLMFQQITSCSVDI